METYSSRKDGLELTNLTKHRDKTATFTFEEALLSPLGFQVLSGAGVVDSKKTVMHYTLRVQATSGGGGFFSVPSESTELDVFEGKKKTKGAGLQVASEEEAQLVITPDMLPKGATIVDKNPKYPLAKTFVMELDANGEIKGKVADIELAPAPEVAAEMGRTGSPGAPTTLNLITSENIKAGTIYLVDLYCEVDGTELTVESGKFAGYYYIEANTLFRRAADGMDVPAQFTIPKGKIQSNFTFTMAGTGDPSTFTFTVDAFPDYLLGATQGEKVLFSLAVGNNAIGA